MNPANSLVETETAWLTKVSVRRGRRCFTSHVLGMALLFGFGNGIVSAADRTWTGSASGQWSNASNWSGGVPGSNDMAILPDTAVNKTIDLGAATRNINSMAIDSDVPFTINNGTLGLTGLSVFLSGNVPTQHTINSAVKFNSTSVCTIEDLRTLEIAGAFDSVNGLSKAGLGTLILSGDNGTTAGNITVSQGGLVLQGGSAYSDSALLAVDANGMLRLEDNETIGGLSGVGTASLGDNALTLTGNASFGGSIQGSAISSVIHVGTGTQTFTGTMNVGLIQSANGVLEFNGGSFTSTGMSPHSAYVNGGATMRIRGGALLELPDTSSGSFNSNGNGYVKQGSLVISESGSEMRGGRVDIGNVAQGYLTVQNGGLLNITEGLDPAIFVGFGDGWTGALLIESGGQALAGRIAAGVNGNDSGTITVDGQGSHLGVNNLISLGSSSAGNPDGTGRLIVTDGATATVGGNVALRSSSSNISIEGGSLTAGGISVDSGVSPAIRISDPSPGKALRLGNNDTISTLNAVIRDNTTGPGGIEKIGTGVLFLAANQLFSGGLLVSEGTVWLKDAARQFVSLTGSGDVIVAPSARLGGTGVIAGGLVAESGASVGAGSETISGVGRIDCGQLELQAGSYVDVKLESLTQSDTIHVSGVATVNGTLTLTYINGFTASDGDTFEIISADSVNGDFDNIVAPDGQNWVTYKADGSLFVRVCNDPATCIAPCAAELDRYAIGATVLSSVGDGEIVVVNRGSAGLEIFAAPNPTLGSPLATISGNIASATGVKSLALDGDRLFVAGGTPRIYDVSDPSNPVLLSTLNGYFGWDVAVQGNLLAVAHDTGLALFDISDPANPVLRNNISQSSEDAANVVFHDGLLYWNRTDNLQGYLVIVDVTNPASPVQLGLIASGSFPSEPQFAGDVAIVGSAQGVRTINVSDPANPTQIAFLSDFSAGTGDAALEGHFLYRADNFAGVKVYDVSDPAMPVEIDRLSAYNGAYGLTNVDGKLYVSRFNGGLALLDVADPDSDGLLAACDACNGDNASGDSDGDGVCDNLDACPAFDDRVDADGDGVPDGCDTCPGFDNNLDADSDGVPDGCDICPGSDDNIDADGDGVPDGCDNCPSTYNPDQIDSDGPDAALSPVAAWHFDEGAGTTAMDVVGGHNGTLNTAGWNAAGFHGSAIEFPAGGSSVSVPGSTDFDPTDHLSVSLWIKPSAFPVNISRLLTHGGPTYVFRLQNGKPHFYVRKDGVLTGTQANVLIEADQWTHLAAVWDGLGDGILRIYINGVEASAYDFQGTVPAPIDATGSGLTLGNGNSERYEGLMDEMALFNHALTPAEVMDVYRMGIGDGVGDVCEAPCGNLQRGDVDASGTVDAADASPLAAILLDPSTAVGDQLCAADVNGDGNIDGRDVQTFVNLILAP